MRITRAYYSYQRINLIAEIGGYVGLFLGVSVIQITNVVDHASRWISSKVEFVPALSTSRILPGESVGYDLDVQVQCFLKCI